MSEIAKLLERVKGMSGPDRGVDAMLFAISDPQAAQHPWPQWIEDQKVGRDDFMAIPRFTASIDAALALANRQHGDHWFSILLDATREFGAMGTLGPEHLPRFIIAATLTALQDQRHEQ